MINFRLLTAGYILLMAIIFAGNAHEANCLLARRDCSGMLDFVLMLPVFLMKQPVAHSVMAIYGVSESQYYQAFTRADQTAVVVIITVAYVLLFVLISRWFGKRSSAR